jgi:hypothetical protein
MPKPNYTALRNRARAVQLMRLDRVNKLLSECGFDYSCLHNRMIDLEQGRLHLSAPRANPKTVRKAAWLAKTMDDASRALDRLYTRKGYAAFDWN